MIVQALTLTNFRALKHMEIELQPDLNVIAGVNGVGKSSIIRALTLLLWHVIDKHGARRNNANVSPEEVMYATEQVFVSSRVALHDKTLDVIMKRTREDLEERQRHEEALSSLRRRLSRTRDSAQDQDRDQLKEDILLHEEALRVMGKAQPPSTLRKVGFVDSTIPQEEYPLAILFNPQRHQIIVARR